MYLTYRNDQSGRTPPIEQWMITADRANIPRGCAEPVWGIFMPPSGISVLESNGVKRLLSEESSRTILDEYSLKVGYAFVIRRQDHSLTDVCHVVRYPINKKGIVAHKTYCNRTIKFGAVLGIVSDGFHVCPKCQYEYWRDNGPKKSTQKAQA